MSSWSCLLAPPGGPAGLSSGMLPRLPSEEKMLVLLGNTKLQFLLSSTRSSDCSWWRSIANHWLTGTGVLLILRYTALTRRATSETGMPTS